MATTTVYPASQKQVALVAKLLKERVVQPENAAWIEGALANHALTSKTAPHTIDHLLACPKKKLSDLPQAPVGMHVLDGQRYKVQASKSGHKRRYASLLVQRLDGTWGFEYVKGAVAKLSEATRMSAEEAAAFGYAHSVCCNCGKLLTDKRSTFAGYGPVCAANNGWPWGDLPPAAE